MQLSKRLAAVADMVTPGLVLADIGTDHAYIPIYLTEHRIIPRAIAADVHRGPLSRAKEHIREHGLEEKIVTRLSDGLAAFSPGEAQSIVMAGMGGALTIRILEEGMREDGALTSEQRSPDGQEHQKSDESGSGIRTELILQPQSEILLVRSWLEQNGWGILREDIVFEDGKFYPMMKAKRCPSGSAFTQPEKWQEAFAEEGSKQPFTASAMSETELLFGPRLLEMRHPVLHRFLLRERETQEKILKSLEQGKSTAAQARVIQIRRYIGRIDEALQLYGGNEA